MLPLLPSEARILTKDVVRRGDYTLVPHSRMASDGTYELIYFLAYRSGPEDFEYIVGPASLNEFASNATEFQERAEASEELLAPGKPIDKYTSWATPDEIGRRPGRERVCKTVESQWVAR